MPAPLRRPSCVAIGCLTALALLLPARAGPALPDKVERYARDAVDRGYTVGVSIALVEPGGVSYLHAGRRSTPSGKPVDAATIYEVGSVTKVFTSLLLADMVERHAVALDDPVAALLPDTVKLPKRRNQAITLIDLATHTSGLPPIPDNMDADGDNPYASYHAEQLYEYLSQLSPADLASGWKYSNLGPGLLGHALARKAGQSYEALLKERVFAPLEMKDTRLTLTAADRGRLAVGHAGDAPMSNWDFDVLAGCGAIRSTPADMATFVSAAMGLTPTPLDAAFRAMLKPHRQTDAKSVEQRLGWLVTTTNEREVIWHNGQTGGFKSFVGFCPATKRGVVVLSNSAGGFNTDAVGMRVLDEKTALPRLRRPAKIDAAILADFVGQYKSPTGLAFDVTRKGDQLMVQLTGQAPYPVYPESDTRFFYKVVDAQITFARGKDGQVESLTLHQNGADQTARRLRPDEIAKQPKEVDVDPAVFDGYVGKYRHPAGLFFTVTRRGKRLMVQLRGQAALQVFPSSKTEYFYKVVDARITFEVDATGKAVKLTLHQNGQDYEATREE